MGDYAGQIQRALIRFMSKPEERGTGCNMGQAVGYSGSEDRVLDSEQESAEIDGVDPWKAAMQGDLDALLQYIDDNGDVNQRDRDNNTPLHWACQGNHLDIVGVLMSRNAAVDPVNDLQSTPLHYACGEGNLDIVMGLINFNANIEARNKDNLTPLHVAAGMGHIEVAKRLLENGAEIEAKERKLFTPLWRAAYYGHPQAVEVLLLKGADKLARNKKGRIPGDLFCRQVEEENKERIKRMLGMGVPHANKDPEPRDETVGPEPRGPAAEPPPYKARADNTEELDNVDLQMQELNQGVVEAPRPSGVAGPAGGRAKEKELDRKRGEVVEARKEVEDATRRAEDRITQLEQDLQAARGSSGGCSCTIS